MTRQECEQKLLEKAKQMYTIMKEYDNDNRYLSIAILQNDAGDSDVTIMINNNHTATGRKAVNVFKELTPVTALRGKAKLKNKFKKKKER